MDDQNTHLEESQIVPRETKPLVRRTVPLVLIFIGGIAIAGWLGFTIVSPVFLPIIFTVIGTIWFISDKTRTSTPASVSISAILLFIFGGFGSIITLFVIAIWLWFDSGWFGDCFMDDCARIEKLIPEILLFFFTVTLPQILVLSAATGLRHLKKRSIWILAISTIVYIAYTVILLTPLKYSTVPETEVGGYILGGLALHLIALALIYKHRKLFT